MALDSHAFKRGEWVAQTRGKYRGRLGLIDTVRTGPKSYCIVPSYVVQFGSGGPFARLQHGSLRRATPEEAAYMEGCRVRDLPEELR